MIPLMMFFEIDPVKTRQIGYLLKSIASNLGFIILAMINIAFFLFLVMLAVSYHMNQD